MRGCHPTINTINTYHNPLDNIITHNHQHTTLKIITWNIGCISSSMLGIQKLTQTLYTDPHIILIQETKLQKHKSTSYIDRKLPDYKIIYNNSNNTTHQCGRYSGPTPTRGGVLAMISKSIHTNENITKIPTPVTISPYLQA